MNSAKFVNTAMEFVTDFSAFKQRLAFAFFCGRRDEVPEKNALFG